MIVMTISSVVHSPTYRYPAIRGSFEEYCYSRIHCHLQEIERDALGVLTLPLSSRVFSPVVEPPVSEVKLCVTASILIEPT